MYASLHTVSNQDIPGSPKPHYQMCAAASAQLSTHNFAYDLEDQDRTRAHTTSSASQRSHPFLVYGESRCDSLNSGSGTSFDDVYSAGERQDLPTKPSSYMSSLLASHRGADHELIAKRSSSLLGQAFVDGQYDVENFF